MNEQKVINNFEPNIITRNQFPICRECGETIEGTSYNFRCGSCAQTLAREEMQDIGKHVQEVSNE